jgi:hypothetical protein
MILRPELPPSAGRDPQQPSAAWEAVFNTQRQPCERCLLVAQPDHAGLAGDIAAQLDPAFLGDDCPRLDNALVRAIGLHDEGWAEFDQAGSSLLTDAAGRPLSFLDVRPPEFVRAWTGSIARAQDVAAAGGIMVSRHFSRLARHRLASYDDTPADQQRLRTFLEDERQCQAALAHAVGFSDAQLERLTDLLQFCDLLSLYLCCGSREWVELPQHFAGRALRIQRPEDCYRLAPPPLRSGASLAVAARRFPEGTRQLIAFVLA